ncbi:MAG: ImmA/IrrE family metallo-endopeptidase [Caldilinea sp. CFX5]|nr:ImmA/IrrE family metallo-endopeptidase [Caldilinea sp. CFX5]
MTMLASLNGKHSKPSQTSMQELYQRLQQAGFNHAFVQDYLLPTWWDDSLGENPTMRAVAEVGIARMIGVSIHALHTPGTPLHLAPNHEFRLKRNKGVTVPELLPAIALAQSAAHILAETIEDLPPFVTGAHALTVREEILAQHATVDLNGLLAWAWTHGIIVVHLCRLPMHAKKFSGIALFHATRPVIVLADGRDSPPWLAFHLAHELGHILLGHVQPGQLLLDDNIDRRQRLLDAVEDLAFERIEAEANVFAMTLLTAQPEMRFAMQRDLNGEKLASCVQQRAGQSRIDAGTLALLYGYSAGRMGVAQNALKRLGRLHGAHELIAEMLKRHLAEELPESLSALLPLINCR